MHKETNENNNKKHTSKIGIHERFSVNAGQERQRNNQNKMRAKKNTVYAYLCVALMDTSV